MSERTVLVGYCKIDHDTVMTNRGFSYAADFETLLVKEGVYNIIAYEGDLDRRNGIRLGWRSYIHFTGEIISNSFGDKAGTPTHYSVHCYDYTLAKSFFDGYSYVGLTKYEYFLNPEWELELSEFEVSGERKFTMDVVLKDGAELQFVEEV